MTGYTPAMVRVFHGGCFLYRINDQEIKTGNLEHKHSKPVGVVFDPGIHQNHMTFTFQQSRLRRPFISVGFI